MYSYSMVVHTILSLVFILPSWLNGWFWVENADATYVNEILEDFVNFVGNKTKTKQKPTNQPINKQASKQTTQLLVKGKIETLKGMENSVLGRYCLLSRC